MSQRLGDLLVKEKVITPEQLAQATKVQKETNCRLGSALVKLGFLNDEDVTNFLSRQYGVPAINLSYFEIDPAVVKLIPFETAKRYQILPLSRVGASLTIAMVDPTNVFAMDDIKFMTGFNIEPVVASEVRSPRHRKSLRDCERGRPRAGHAVDQMTPPTLSCRPKNRRWISASWRKPPKKRPS